MIDFRDYQPGLYFIKGENNDEPDLGSNGSGKSTIWDALHWCWFGASVRGTPTTQLVPWTGSGKPAVEFAARFDGENRFPGGGGSNITRIIRTHRPNTLTIRQGGKTKQVTQEEVDDLLGLTSEAVQSSIIIGQYSRYFFDLKPVEKMRLLTDLMELDYWLECSDKARGALSVLKEDKHQVETKLAAAVAVRDKLKSDLEMMQSEQRAISEDSEIEGLELSLDAQKEEKNKLKRRLKSQKGQLDEAEDRMADLNKSKSSWAEKVDDQRDTIREIDFTIRETETAIEKLKKQIQALKQIKFGRDAGRCPACNQPVTDGHRRQEIKRLEGMLTDLTDVRKELLEAHARERAREDRAKNEVNKFRTAIQSFDIREIEKRIDRTEVEISSVEKDMSRTRDQIYFIEQHDQKQKDAIEKVRSSLVRRRAEIKTIRSGVQELETAIEQASYWVKAFKDIRLFEINDVLTSLEVEINSYLADLGMPDWSVSLEIERSTRKGTISRGFRVMVDPGIGAKGGTKPWEAWSGGEGQRLRSAGTLALANLILRQHNRSCNFQVLDEKLYWLSGQGENDMLELLQELAVSEGKRIFIIDQHNLDFPFDGEIKVIKNHHGSRVVQ